MGTRTFRRAREVLNELKWREGRDMSQAEIWFADRNEPLGYKVIRGGDIMEVGRGYFSTAEAMLPYYKILRIEYRREGSVRSAGSQPENDWTVGAWLDEGKEARLK